jgi:spore germination protein GerM
VLVYVQKRDYGRRFETDPRTFVALPRRITESEARAPLKAALLRLMRGQPRERRLGCVTTFSNHAHLLEGVGLRDGRAVVSFRPSLFEELPAASAHGGLDLFLTQVRLTALQFPAVDSVRFDLGGSCGRFGVAVEAFGCVILRR